MICRVGVMFFPYFHSCQIVGSSLSASKRPSKNHLIFRYVQED